MLEPAVDLKHVVNTFCVLSHLELHSVTACTHSQRRELKLSLYYRHDKYH